MLTMRFGDGKLTKTLLVKYNKKYMNNTHTKQRTEKDEEKSTRLERRVNQTLYCTCWGDSMER